MANGCFPWFHTLGSIPNVTIGSGCRPDGNGNIQCAPEAMRADAEKKLQATGYWPKALDLATYTLARNISSEVGDRSVEEQVALAESTVNQGLLRGASSRREAALNTALYRQPSRLYGQINNPSGGSLKSGRFTATSADPTLRSILIADLVLSGNSGDFAQGADDQDGLEYQSSFPVPMNRILQYAQNGSYWVGPLPGVDHWRLTLFRKYGVSQNSPAGQALIERARAVFGSPAYSGGKVAASLRPSWPADMPICSKPTDGWLVFLGVFGTFLGGWAFHRGLIRRLGQ